MSDVYKVIFSGRLTGDPKLSETSNNKSICKISVASNIGFGDYKKTVFSNCTAFGKSAEFLAERLSKGDQIFIEGTKTQNKDENGKVWESVNILEWVAGAKNRSKNESEGDPKDKPFNDDDIPF